LTFGDSLKRERKKAHLSQHETGKMIGRQETTIYRIESGKSVSPEVKRRLLEVFPELRLGAIDETPKPSTNLDSSSLAEWVRIRREEKRIDARELAQKIGVSKATIQLIETGGTESPQKSTLDSLASVLGPLPERLSQKIHKESLVEDLEYRGAFPLDGWEKNVENDEPTPCVYVFYDKGQRPVYIGATENLRRRITQHSDRWWFKQPTAETFAYITVRDKKLRLKIEKAMIKLVGERYAMFNVRDKR
jgi:transcriptional regulator with XRE-family HTH domain